MGELAVSDVVAFTGGRLTDDGPTGETQRMLTAALQVARREVGWPVSPVQVEQEFVLDGPDSRILWLPTLKLVNLIDLEEDETTIAVADVKASAGDGSSILRRVALRKIGAGFWTGEYGAIRVVMDHGFTEDEAADWRQAILSMVDQMSLLPVKASTGVSDFGQRSWRVDDVSVGYNPYAAMAEEVLFSICSIIDKYKLPALEYL